MDGRAESSGDIQYAALPYRRSADGSMDILLITSRGSGQWIIPKGKPIGGLSPQETAAQEAFEEAGLLGEMGSSAIGRFAYVKDVGQKTERLIPFVHVYPMEVTRQLTLWPEMGQRRLLWFSAEDAAKAVDLKALRKIIRQFAAA